MGGVVVGGTVVAGGMVAGGMVAGGMVAGGTVVPAGTVVGGTVMPGGVEPDGDVIGADGFVTVHKGPRVVLLPSEGFTWEPVDDGSEGRELRSGLAVFTGISSKMITASSKLPKAIKTRLVIKNILLGCII